MNSIRLYFKYAAMNLRCKMQYKAWPFLILGVMINATIDFIGVRILFSRFGSLGEWSASHTLMVYAIATSAFGLAEWFSRGYDSFPWQVRSGLFDKILLRPRTTFLQIIGEKFEFERSGRVIIGVICIIIASSELGISWNVLSLLTLIGAILGGYFVYTGIMIIFAAFSFYSVGSINGVYLFTNHTLQYSQIPFHTMPNIVKNALTFIFPIALCNYYPALFILNNTMSIKSFIALPVGMVFFLVSILVWNIAKRGYKSTGS